MFPYLRDNTPTVELIDSEHHGLMKAKISFWRQREYKSVVTRLKKRSLLVVGTPTSLVDFSPKDIIESGPSFSRSPSSTTSFGSSSSSSFNFPSSAPLVTKTEKLPGQNAQYFFHMDKVRRQIEERYNVRLSLSVLNESALQIKSPSSAKVDACIDALRSYNDQFITITWSSPVMRNSGMDRYCKKHNIWVKSAYTSLDRSQDILVIPTEAYEAFRRKFQKNIPKHTAYSQHARTTVGSFSSGESSASNSPQSTHRVRTISISEDQYIFFTQPDKWAALQALAQEHHTELHRNEAHHNLTVAGKGNITPGFHAVAEEINDRPLFSKFIPLIDQGFSMNWNADLSELMKNYPQVVIQRTQNNQLCVVCEAKHELSIHPLLEKISELLPDLEEVFYPLRRFMQQALAEFYTAGLKDLRDHYLTDIAMDKKYGKTHRNGLRIVGTLSNLKVAVPMVTMYADQLYQAQVVDKIPIDLSLAERLASHLKFGPKMTSFLRNLPITKLLFPDYDIRAKLVAKFRNKNLQKIYVREGSLLDCRVDAYAIPANTELQITGDLPQKVMDASPASMRREFEFIKAFYDTPKIGGAIHTITAPPSTLYCIHTFIPSYGSVNYGSSMRECIKSILEKAKYLGSESIALPLLGVEQFKWPADEAAKVISDSLLELLPKYPKILSVTLVSQVDGSDIESNSEKKSYTDTIIDALNLYTEGAPMTQTKDPPTSDIASGIQTTPSTESLNGKAKPVRWYWKDEDNNWRAYDELTNSSINTAVSEEFTGVPIPDASGNVIHFANSVEKIANSEETREVGKDIPDKMSVQWQWRHEDGSFVSYPEDLNKQINSSYRGGQNDFILRDVPTNPGDSVNSSRADFRINFNKMIQINTNSEQEHDIRFIEQVEARLEKLDNKEDPQFVRFITFNFWNRNMDNEGDRRKIKRALNDLLDQWRHEAVVEGEVTKGQMEKLCKKYGCALRVSDEGKFYVSGEEKSVETIRDVVSALF